MASNLQIVQGIETQIRAKREPQKQENKESKLVISQDLRKFLEPHMEKGKKIDVFLGEINGRTKEYASDVLKINDRAKDMGGKTGIAFFTEEVKAINARYYEDIRKIVVENTTATFKESAALLGMSAAIGAGLGLGITGVGVLASGTALSAGTVAGMGAFGAGLRSLGTIANLSSGMSPSELKVLEKLAKEGIIPAGVKETEDKNRSARSSRVAGETLMFAVALGAFR